MDVVFISLFTLLQSAILRVQSQVAPSAAQQVQSYPPVSSETPAQPTGQIPLALLQGIMTAPQTINPSASAESNAHVHQPAGSHQPASVPQSATALSYRPPVVELATAHTFPPIVAAIPSRTEAALPADQSFQSRASPAPAQPQQTPAKAATDGQLHDFSNMQQTAPVHLSQAPPFQQVHLLQHSAKLVPCLPHVYLLYG